MPDMPQADRSEPEGIVTIQRWIDSLTPIQNVSYPALDVARLLSKIKADHVAALAQAEQRVLDRFATDPLRVLQSYEQGQRDVFALHTEWTVTGMCKLGCLPCQRLDELIAERHAGYEEGQQDALAATDDFLHDDPCDCDQCLVVLRVRNRLREVIYGYPTKEVSE
jgi:hypothetical protein